ncbi:glutamine-hydrolyzing carbamoyl-phosphate synthase small subunit [Halonatronum saccharophilum]|uniref:glutamine-hydrolyzing carbamoyl-phosphate synthase small subunit n=1 Tax=Halonatronum saccharophilum TaxID=150060 RepID=UPI0004886E91|nr:glutamine-hydrolyzing carbamoyl-phosphate synthase small subunit [Halonatronum saccharophilum]
MKKARLVLEDGTVFEGISFGADKESSGEIVFNTSMTGYQEILTDPSYKGEIVAMTYPMIGNYGINEEDIESFTAHANGFIVKEFCPEPSNWRFKSKLENYLKENGIVGIAGVDTRALTKRLRIEGTMKGIITTKEKEIDELIKEAKNAPGLSGRDLVSKVSSEEPYTEGESGQYKVALLDCGAKKNIVRSLVGRDCEVRIFPAKSSSEELLAYNPDGIMLSNGPGDPEDASYVVETVKELLGKKPIFGICLGHQMLGMACGAKTYKMKFGHRGANHPVKDLKTGKVYISSQNHGFAIDVDSVEELDIEVTHINVNDRTVEGLKHKTLPAFSVQYHPEASPGPEDSHYLFDEFIEMMRDHKN